MHIIEGENMFKNMKILILGMARSGVAAAKVLKKRGNIVIINDIKEEHDKDTVKELNNLGVKLILGSHPLEIIDDSINYVIKNPGIRDDHKLIKRARELGIPVINEVELAYLLLPKDVTLIGITGTNGKTTTTTLTYEIMHKAYGDRVHLVGNIGYPFCNVLDKLKKDDFIVMEVSVQQSVNIDKFHPHVALLTNFSPAHIDFLGTYENYKKTKAKMFYNQGETDITIMNLNNQDVLDELKDIKSNKKYFSSSKKTNCYLKDNEIYYNDVKVIDTSIIKIPGIHNIENILGAISIAKEFNVSNKVIKDVIKGFTGVEHRLEFVDEIDNVRFYNDTEATNIKCTQIALSSFNRPTIIILGGLERGQNFNDLDDYIKNVKAIIGIGECRERVREFGKKNNIDTFIHEQLKDGFMEIEKIMKEGDIVLLSPASASWDQYPECEVRGAEFKELVKKLKNEKNS